MASTGRTPGALFCDTNVLIRLLTGAPASQALAVERSLEAAAGGAFRILLPDLVAAEMAYVLTTLYDLAPPDAAERIRAVLDLPGVEAADPALLRDALALWARQRIDFTDAYLAVLTASTEGTAILSLDTDYDRIGGVTRVDPAQVP